MNSLAELRYLGVFRNLFMQKIYFIIFLSALLVLSSSCEKDPGEGGQASITGKVYVKEYNGNCSELRDEYFGVDEEVYIIAGDDPSYFERLRTGPDGVFWFPYLRKGKYQVYAISENCSVPGQREPIIKVVEIDERKQELVTEDIIVIR